MRHQEQTRKRQRVRHLFSASHRSLKPSSSTSGVLVSQGRGISTAMSRMSSCNAAPLRSTWSRANERTRHIRRPLMSPMCSSGFKALNRSLSWQPSTGWWRCADPNGTIARQLRRPRSYSPIIQDIGFVLPKRIRDGGQLSPVKVQFAGDRRPGYCRSPHARPRAPATRLRRSAFQPVGQK